jgi:hypothetical protein
MTAPVRIDFELAAARCRHTTGPLDEEQADGASTEDGGTAQPVLSQTTTTATSNHRDDDEASP